MINGNICAEYASYMYKGIEIIPIININLFIIVNSFYMSALYRYGFCLYYDNIFDDFYGQNSILTQLYNER